MSHRRNWYCEKCRGLVEQDGQLRCRQCGGVGLEFVPVVQRAILDRLDDLKDDVDIIKRWTVHE